jgi:AraC family transcriptional regulator
MYLAARALWFIESHFDQQLTLEDVAEACGVSRFHLSRVFGIATGRSVVRYIRGRRLSEAARALAAGAPDILAVALDAGYGSHEAFTRAFREQFGLTPEALRAHGNLKEIDLEEPMRMDENLSTNLEPPRFENLNNLLIAGLGEFYDFGSIAGIPAQWQRFVPFLGNIAGQTGNETYGVCRASDGKLEYICGVEVSEFAGVPAELTRVRIPPQRYAVFTHRGHITGIRGTWIAILNKWLPESGYREANTPEFEKYGPQFDPRTGNGSLEIWIPIRD